MRGKLFNMGWEMRSQDWSKHVPDKPLLSHVTELMRPHRILRLPKGFENEFLSALQRLCDNDDESRSTFHQLVYAWKRLYAAFTNMKSPLGDVRRVVKLSQILSPQTFSLLTQRSVSHEVPISKFQSNPLLRMIARSRCSDDRWY